MLMRRYYPALSHRLAKPVRIASGLILMLIILGVIIKEKEVLPAYFAEVGIIALTLNVLMMALGYLIGRGFRLSAPQSMSISIEIGIQNGTLVLAIVVGLLRSTAFEIDPAVYSVSMMLTGCVMIYLAMNMLASS